MSDVEIIHKSFDEFIKEQNEIDEVFGDYDTIEADYTIELGSKNEMEI